MGKILSRAALAEVLGVALTTLDRYVADGMPTLDGHGSGKGVARRFDSAKAIAWTIDRAVAEPDPKSPTTPDGEISLHEALRRKELANARSAELRLEDEMADVAPAETLKRVISEELTAVKVRLRAIPAKFLPLSRAQTTTAAKAQRATSALSDLIDEALSEIKAA